MILVIVFLIGFGLSEFQMYSVPKPLCFFSEERSKLKKRIEILEEKYEEHETTLRDAVPVLTKNTQRVTQLEEAFNEMRHSYFGEVDQYEGHIKFIDEKVELENSIGTADVGEKVVTTAPDDKTSSRRKQNSVEDNLKEKQRSKMKPQAPTPPTSKVRDSSLGAIPKNRTSDQGEKGRSSTRAPSYLTRETIRRPRSRGPVHADIEAEFESGRDQYITDWREGLEHRWGKQALALVRNGLADLVLRGDIDIRQLERSIVSLSDTRTEYGFHDTYL